MNKDTFIRRRKVWISREGFSFLFVLIFILVGALVRQVNLLFVLAGLLIAAILVNWRYAVASIGNLSVTRESPALIHAGQQLLVRIRVENRHRWLTCWSLNVRDVVRKSFDPQLEFYKQTQHGKTKSRRFAKAKMENVTVNIQEIRPAADTQATLRLELAQRGRYTMGPLKLSTRFPLGLLWAYGPVKQFTDVTVAPRIGRFTTKWLRLVSGRDGRGNQTSLQHSPHADGDFYSVRTWQSGDSRRAIHWRSTAKTGSLEVRQFENQTNPDLAIVLDLWQPVDADEHRIAATELAASVAATAVDLALKQEGGRICVAIAGNDSEVYCGAHSRELRNQILRYLATVLPAEDTNVDQAIVEATSRMKQAYRLIVISTRQDQRRSTSTGSPRVVSNWLDVSTERLDTLYHC